MKKLLLFDVDGTITESGQQIEDSIKNMIQHLSKKYDIGIVGGGKIEKILEQMGDDNYFHYYFSECGCVFHENVSPISNLDLVKRYSKNLRQHKLYPMINTLIKTSLSFLSQVDYTITGNFIDLRNGIIYVSLIGMSANSDERKYFISLDKKNGYRKQLLLLLKEEAIKLNIYHSIQICEGGSVGIAIYPNEYDKVQVYEHLKDKYSEIHYFGDKYHEDGNDYHIINHFKIIGHCVDNIQDTINILSRL